MRKLHNECRFIGNLGSDPQMSTIGLNTVKASFSIAVERREKNDRGEYVRGDPLWVSLVAFGDYAQFLSRLIHKGDRVLVVCSLDIRTVNTDGESRTYHNFVVRDLEVLRFINRHNDNDGYEDAEDDDDGLPF